MNENHSVDRKTASKELSLGQMLSESGAGVFTLVRLAQMRALEIQGGSPSLISKHVSDKPTIMALEEISQGKVTLSPRKIK